MTEKTEKDFADSINLPEISDFIKVDLSSKTMRIPKLI